MRVALTGGSGFIGRALLTRLHAEGIPCGALVRHGALWRGGAEVAVRALPQAGDPEERWAEILQDTDVLVHLAARAHQGEGADPAALAAFEKINVGLTTRLALGAAKSGVRHLIYMSSIKVCGERSATNADGRVSAFSQDSPPAPEGPYGASKLRAEQSLREICTTAGVSLSIFRPPLVYGVGMRGNLKSLLRVLDLGLPLPLASIHNQRSLIHRDSLVDAVLRAIKADRPGAAVYTLADLDFSTPDLVRAMARGLGKPARLFPFPPRLLCSLGTLAGKASAVDRLTESLRVDGSYAMHELGWQPRLDTEDAWAEIGRCYRLGGEAWQ